MSLGVAGGPTTASARGIRPSSFGPRSSSHWPELTESEFAVVSLVAQGATNREVADRLYLSPYTVNSHLRHVFTKLGIRSRVELARLAAARGLPGQRPARMLRRASRMSAAVAKRSTLAGAHAWMRNVARSGLRSRRIAVGSVTGLSAVGIAFGNGWWPLHRSW